MEREDLDTHQRLRPRPRPILRRPPSASPTAPAAPARATSARRAAATAVKIPLPPSLVNKCVNPRTYAGSYAADWILRREELSPGAKLLYVALARYYNNKAKCAWPGYTKLAAFIGLSPSMVKKHVQTLKAHGLISVARSDTSNRYRFLYHAWMIGAKLRPEALKKSK